MIQAQPHETEFKKSVERIRDQLYALVQLHTTTTTETCTVCMLTNLLLPSSGSDGPTQVIVLQVATGVRHCQIHATPVGPTCRSGEANPTNPEAATKALPNHGIPLQYAAEHPSTRR